MALNSNTLKNAILSRMKALWRSDPPSNKVHDENYFLDEFAKIIAEEVVDHFVTFARCNGTDSGADSHDNVGII